ncbi:hypothetical protein AB1A65_13060 [Muricauda sp. ANG21]|uniref:hypothetical protein n=1 Tax=Allomuricauda sp. ANG21 TaxID=3042468 RepID=UPI0034560A16
MAVKNSDVVVIGEVVKKNIISKSIRNGNSGKNEQLLLKKYGIQISKAYKGVRQDKIVFIYTTSQPSACGLQLNIGETYMIFGTKGSFLPPFLDRELEPFERQSYWSNSCSATQEFTKDLKAEVETSLGG